jgi:HEPN domain-containing protein
MKAATRDWIEKAEADHLAAVDLARRRKLPLHDMVCFHCQQSAEKYLKARMQEAGLRVPKTHDLEVLLDLLLPLEPMWSALRPAADFLTDYAVEFRYPGNEASAANAKAALTKATVIRKEARASLGL